MKKNVTNVFFNSTLVIVLFAGCLIEDVEQPTEIEAGQIFTSVLNISAIAEETTNPHHGIIAVLHPLGWEFESGTFESTDPSSGDPPLLLRLLLRFLVLRKLLLPGII